MRSFGTTARRAAVRAAVPLALLGSGALIWQSSHSAFQATTATGASSWTTGTVTITKDQAGQAVFTITNIVPDNNLSALSPGTAAGAYTASRASSGGSRCIKVTYNGTVSTNNIRMYATVGGADLATFGGQLLMTVDAVTSAAAANPNCSTYPAGGTYIYGSSGTTTSVVKNFPTSYNAANATIWNNATTGQAKFYRISWLLPSTVTQTSTTTANVTATFTWEAQST